MKARQTLTALLALVLFGSMLAVGGVGSVAAQDQCDQVNSQLNALNVNADTNANALNTAANVPVLSPNTGDGDQSAEANQEIRDSNDDFQSQSNKC